MNIPEYLSTDWFSLEERIMVRARELLHENAGEVRFTLSELENDLRDELQAESTHEKRVAARRLVNHVEQCWATAILR